MVKMVGKPLVLVAAIVWLMFMGSFCGQVYAQTDNCSAKIEEGKVVTLTATACPGSKFVKWTCPNGEIPCPCEGQGKVCTFTMPKKDILINVQFDKMPKPVWKPKWRQSGM